MLKRIVDLVASLEGIGLIAALILGIGCLAFVSVTWVIYLIDSQRVATGGIVAASTLALVAAALARIPVALILVLCSAVVVSTAILSGASNLVFP